MRGLICGLVIVGCVLTSPCAFAGMSRSTFQVGITIVATGGASTVKPNAGPVGSGKLAKSLRPATPRVVNGQ